MSAMIILLTILILTNIILSVINMKKLQKHKSVDNFKQISKVGNSSNKFLGTFKNKDRSNYMIFNNDNTVISNKWGVQKYSPSPFDNNAVIIGDDPENGKVAFLKAYFDGFDTNTINTVSIDPDSLQEIGYYSETFYKWSN